MNKLKTIEDACKLTGETLYIPEGTPPDEAAYKELKIRIKALNMLDGKPYDPIQDGGYFPHFWKTFDKDGGVGFSFNDFDFGHLLSSVSSRLLLKTPELAIRAGKELKNLYEAFHLK